MHNLWTVQTGYNLGTYQEKVPTTINLPVSGADTITRIAGSIPPGLQLSGSTLTGTPFQVSRETAFQFCLRASHENRVQDRTFTINILGPDAPNWVTNEGLLPVGENDQLFILDSSYVDYQLEAIDADLSANTVLEYYIPEGGGELPPGLSLSSSGRITGIVDPVLALDILSSTGYYDSNDYASAPFDFGLTNAIGAYSYYFDIQAFSDLYNVGVGQRVPSKLNRYYQFTVNVTDGDSTASRTFRIFVVGDDFLRADNTIMQVGTGVFTSDGTYLRVPRWLTPADLGYKRANNNVTIFLELYDPNTVPGVVNYFLEKTNPGRYKLISTGEIIDNGHYEITKQLPDFPLSKIGPNSNPAIQVGDWEVITPETASVLPEGLSVDEDSGEIAGKIPYQPQVTKQFDFTISAVRSASDSDLVTVIIVPYEDTMAFDQNNNAVSELKIQKLPTGLADGIDDLESLVGQIINVNNVNYTVKGVNGQNQNYDILTFDRALESDDLKAFVGTVYEPKAFKNGTQTAIILANNEIFVYGRVNKDRYKTRTLKFGNNEYIIEDIQSVLAEGEPALQGISGASSIEKIIFNVAFTENLVDSRNISIAAFENAVTQKSFLLDSTDIQPTAKKTFNLKVLGEVDSSITWQTDSDLGSIKANLNSHFRLQAQSTVPDSQIKYILTDGNLPFGLSLSLDGEILGTVGRFGEGDYNSIWQPIRSYSADDIVLYNGQLYKCLTAHTSSNRIDNGVQKGFEDDSILWQTFSYTKFGLTTFDSQSLILDGGTTTVDKTYSFTVTAQDRFGFSAVSRTFNLQVIVDGNNTYTDLYVQPLLNQSQRDYFYNFISNPSIFDLEKIYRPNDTKFGIQTKMKMLVYAGIEKKLIANYVTAVSSNHKRRRFNFGEIKVAQAKFAGTNEVAYEVVYIEVIDPKDSSNIKNNVRIGSSNKIKINQTQLEVSDDTTKLNVGGSSYTIFLQSGSSISLQATGQDLEILTRQGVLYLDLPNGQLTVLSQDGSTVLPVGTVEITEADPFRFRPKNSVIKVDSDLIRASASRDETRYISTLTNMRSNIENLGTTEGGLLPLWMKTAQGNSLSAIGYVSAVPLCYCKPGQAESIRLAIKNSDFDPKNINFEIDRYIVDGALNNDQEQYVLFPDYQYNV